MKNVGYHRISGNNLDSQGLSSPLQVQQESQRLRDDTSKHFVSGPVVIVLSVLYLLFDLARPPSLSDRGGKTVHKTHLRMKPATADRVVKTPICSHSDSIFNQWA